MLRYSTPFSFCFGDRGFFFFSVRSLSFSFQYQMWIILQYWHRWTLVFIFLFYIVYMYFSQIFRVTRLLNPVRWMLLAKMMDTQLSLPALLKCILNFDSLNLVVETFPLWTQYLSVVRAQVAWGAGRGRPSRAQLTWPHKEGSILSTNEATGLHLSFVSCVQREGQRESRVCSCIKSQSCSSPFPSYFCTSWYEQTKAVITGGEAESLYYIACAQMKAWLLLWCSFYREQWLAFGPLQCVNISTCSCRVPLT